MGLNTDIMFARQSAGSSAWQGWKRIDNFGCSTPADLASLLGVGRATTGSNPNLLTQGFVSAWFETDAEAEQAGYVKRDNNLVFGTSFDPTNSNFATAQICFCTYDNSVYTRSRTSGASVPWSSWVRVDNFGANTPADLASLLGVNKYFVSLRKTTIEPIEYDLIVNGNNDGLTYLVLWSCNTNEGDSSSSAIYMLRCGYSGNHLTTVEITHSNMPSDSRLIPSFTASQNGKMTISGVGKFLFIREPTIF
jgi:hypothetical protein